MKISLQLVTWNGAKYLPRLFESLKTQTYKDWGLFILDNGSTDETVKIIENAKKDFPSMKLTQNKENTGFSHSHNVLFEQSDSPYILLVNQDTEIEPDVMEKMVAFMDEHENVASMSPRLMRRLNGQKTEIIDSLGLEIKRSRRVVDIDAGCHFDSSVESSKNVFGVSAALAMYRRSAVLKTGSGLFDLHYFSYKEDFDLAWRLRLAGFDSAVLLSAVAYHDRGAAEDIASGTLTKALNKKRQSYLVRYHSYKNQLATIYKNEQWQNFFLDFPRILWYEGSKFIYFLLFERTVLKGIGELWKKRKILQKERARIQHSEVVSWREMRKWFKN